MQTTSTKKKSKEKTKRSSVRTPASGQRENGSTSSKSSRSRVTSTRTVTTSNVERSLQDKANTLYDGTGRLYECMSIAELTIRLRNLADHSLQTHEGDVQQREKLLHEIKDAQKTLNDLLKDLKDEMMADIRGRAQQSGKNAERIVQLKKINEDLESRLRGAELEVQEKERKMKELQNGIERQVAAVQKQRDADVRREQQVAADAKRDISTLRQQLDRSQKELAVQKRREQELEEALRGIQNERAKLDSEIASLKEQLSAKDVQDKALSPDSKRLQARVKDLEAQAKRLQDELGKVQNEAKSKESAIGDLLATNKALDEKLEQRLETQFEKLIDSMQNIESAKRDTDDLKRYYKEHLDRMHKLWEDSSQQIKDVFEQNYHELKTRLEGAYNDAEQKCKELEKDNKRLNIRVRELNEEKTRALEQLNRSESEVGSKEERISTLSKKASKLNNDLVAMQVKVSQYRVIWNHYMTLEGKLKNEIGHLDKGMTDFEEQMRVEPPMPKRRQQRIGAIREYGTGYLPLQLSEVPTPELLYFRHHFDARSQSSRRRTRRGVSSSNNNNNNNNSNNNSNNAANGANKFAEEKEVATDDIDNSRFLLVNSSLNTHLTLVGEWFLVNDRNDRIPLPRDIQLAPGASIGLCMGDERAQASDILLKEHRTRDNKPFITFEEVTDRLYLEDTVGEVMELFSPSLPTREEEEDAAKYVEDDNDDFGGVIEEAHRAKNYIGVGEFDRLADRPHFTIVNLSRKPIVLRGFKLRRHKGSWQMKFPEFEITQDRGLRFLFAKEKENGDDLLIDPDDFGTVEGADSLVLEDKYGGRYHVLPHIPTPNRPAYDGRAKGFVF